jgi:hypothetical protein
MESLILIGTGIGLLIWLMSKVETRKSTPELYPEYKSKKKIN